MSELLERLSALMVEIRDGSGAALQELIDLLWEDLVRFAARELGDVDEARDVVQDSFVYLWERRRSWIPAGSPRAYLFRVVRNHVIDAHRRTTVREAWAQRERATPTISPDLPDAILVARRMERVLEETVAGLPERKRAAFDLVVFRGLTHQEAADVLGISKQTVSNQISSALAEVRAALRPFAET